MNKKTFFKISGTALLLCVSIGLSVRYFPEVALAVKSGVITSAAPLVAFAVFAIIAAITLTVLDVSAICSKDTKGKPNGISEEPKSKNKEKGQNLKVVPTPTPPLPSHVTEELASTVLQQQPDDNLTKEMETPQLETDDDAVVNGDSAEQQVTLESLNSLPYPSTSPLNTENQDQPLPPAPPSDDSNPVQNHEQQDRIPIPAQIKIALPAFERGREVGKRERAAMIRALIPLIHSPSRPANGEEENCTSLPLPYKPLPYKEGEEHEVHHSLPTQFMKINDSEVRDIIHARKYEDNFWGNDFDSLSSNVSCNGPNSLLPTAQHLDSI